MSSAGWGSSAHGEETFDGSPHELPAPELKRKLCETFTWLSEVTFVQNFPYTTQSTEYWCYPGEEDKQHIVNRGECLLIGCPSRKWMLWSTSPCLARRLSSQYFIIPWRSWKQNSCEDRISFLIPGIKTDKDNLYCFYFSSLKKTSTFSSQSSHFWPLTCEVKKQSSLSMFS